MRFASTRRKCSCRCSKGSRHNLDLRSAALIMARERPFVASFSKRCLMELQTAEQLTTKKCKACEGGVDPYSLSESKAQLAKLPGWKLTDDGQRIRREWVVKNFMAGMRFFNKVAEVAEDDNHHPDLHLIGYRNVAIEL